MDNPDRNFQSAGRYVLTQSLPTGIPMLILSSSNDPNAFMQWNITVVILCIV